MPFVNGLMSYMLPRFINVTLVYATPTEQYHYALRLPEKITLIEAVQASPLLQDCPELDLQSLSVGIWGESKAVDMMAKTGDRIEVYRPLLIDPKQARQEKVRRERLKARQTKI